ncbi:hypothetical protein PAXRUDRAFT_20273 [Paxillus rubicundulus Ve08.2h10]|uniref:Uncharacterized protein n=1 Tax=Paxillus rubicundulus Ve08.2h10 TaxID=930991 RepID=A0A0D0CSV5_9AGAM|nr:hypothetical protein PAXRUDRAFT_20273 [Paxillus rubicundulus Ve08.2h10]
MYQIRENDWATNPNIIGMLTVGYDYYRHPITCDESIDLLRALPPSPPPPCHPIH